MTIEKTINVKEKTTTNVKEKTGTIADPLKKGTMAEGVIIRITDGLASDFMTPNQIEKRQTKIDDPYTEIEIGIPDKGVILKPITFLDYTRINKGLIPANSRMAQIMGICDLKEDGSIPLIVKEINVVRNGNQESFMTWEIAL
jgi:hypothetical protein